jgi:hypothetical protein
MDEFDTKVLYEQVFGKAADNNPDYDRRMKRIESMVEACSSATRRTAPRSCSPG